MTTWKTLGSITSLIAGATCAQATNAAETPSAAVAPQATAMDSMSAKRVVRDKDTGKLRAPSDEELAEMIAAERADRQVRGLPDPATAAPALIVRQHADGMLSAVLGQEHLVTVTAVRGAGGKLVKSHQHAAHEHPTAKPAQRPTE